MTDRHHFGYFCTLLFLLASLASLPGFAGEITIYRDVWGVPHIYADAEADGFYGLGYAQAEDRLRKLSELVHWARGSVSSIASVGEQGMVYDREATRWRHLQEARAGLKRLSPQLRRNYQAFIDGISAYIADNLQRAPDWAPDFRVEDLIAVNRAMFWGMYQSGDGMGDCKRGGRELAPLNPVEYPSGASNGWVLAPSRTAEGVVILSADPHSEMAGGAYYEYHLQAGDLHSAGFAMGPMLWQAHNGRVAWAMTTGNPDVVDCIEIEMDPHNPDRYRFDEEWREFLQLEVELEIANSPKRTLVHRYTSHNGVLSPLVARQGNKAYVISSAYMHQAGALDEEIYRMNKADSVDDVFKAMQGLGMFPQNLLIGDSNGDIAYVHAGRTPRRPSGFNWKQAVPGNSSASAWLGVHPLEDLIQLKNSPEGYFTNNNVAPDHVIGGRRAVNFQDYPDYIFNDNPGRITTRGLRTFEYFSQHPKMSVADALALTVDEKWMHVTPWQDALAHAAKQHSTWVVSQDDFYQQVLKELLNFDGHALARSTAALMFYHWREGMWQHLQQPQFTAIHQFPWMSKDFSPEFSRYLLDKISATIDVMQQRYGTVDISLGEVFRIGRTQLNAPLGGTSIEEPDIDNCLADSSPFCERTMRAFGSSPPNKQGQRFAARGSQSTRVIAFTNPIQTYTAHAYGQSYVENSSHYNDQIQLFADKQLKRVYFDRESVVKHAVSSLVLQREQKVSTP